MKENKGISLIALVITIIIIIILAGSVILSLANNNPISKATEAVFKENAKTYDSELSIILAQKYLGNTIFNLNNFNAKTWSGSGPTTDTIKEALTSISDRDAKKFEIQSGKLTYVGTDELEKKWAKECGINVNNGGFALITFDGSSFNEEAEFYQRCLKVLGYKTDGGGDIDIDGYFGNQSKSVLAKFLQAEGFTEFNGIARDKLVERAENVSYAPYDFGFIQGQTNLQHVSFVYCSLKNVDEKNDPFYTMHALSQLPYMVTAEPGELSYSSWMVAEYLKKTVKLFGYVNMGPNNPTSPRESWEMANLTEVKSQIDNIAADGWYGVFVDQFGYDWNETRARQNEIIDYAHSKGLSVMVNGWFVDDVFGAIVNESNPTGTPTHLNSRDWYLAESFFSDGGSTTNPTQSPYRTDVSSMNKYIQAMQYHQNTNINITTLTYKDVNKTWSASADDIKMSYVLAASLNYNGWWFGKSDNTDILTYGKDPIVDLGTFTQYLTYQSGTTYIAKTTKYTIEFNAGTTPTMNLIPN